MSLTLQDIEKEAMLLSVEERETLADKLALSLQEEKLTDVDVAWIEEAEKRYLSYLDGKTKGLSAEKVFAEIRQELGWRD